MKTDSLLEDANNGWSQEKSHSGQNYLANYAYIIQLIDFTCSLNCKHFTQTVFISVKFQNCVLISFLFSHCGNSPLCSKNLLTLIKATHSYYYNLLHCEPLELKEEAVSIDHPEPGCNIAAISMLLASLLVHFTLDRWLWIILPINDIIMILKSWSSGWYVQREHIFVLKIICGVW